MIPPINAHPAYPVPPEFFPVFPTDGMHTRHQICRLERWQYNPFMSFLPSVCTLVEGILQSENEDRARKIVRGLTGIVPLIGGPLLNFVDNGTCCGRRPGLDD